MAHCPQLDNHTYIELLSQLRSKKKHLFHLVHRSAKTLAHLQQFYHENKDSLPQHESSELGPWVRGNPTISAPTSIDPALPYLLTECADYIVMNSGLFVADHHFLHRFRHDCPGNIWSGELTDNFKGIP